MNAPQPLSRWADPASSRVPFWAYTDAQLYQRELDKIFYGKHWCYVGLEVEIPKFGDYKLSWVGERQVIMVRDRKSREKLESDPDSGIRVVENRCAHRGVRFCQQPHGNARSFVCPYHQWTYKLNGELAGLPFKDGVKDGDCVNGGMPADFDPKQHGLTQLRVAVLHGLVFATFSADTEPLEDYFGPQVMPWLNRIFQGPSTELRTGRELTLLGYNRQRIPGNWKLMMENIKDPYHPGLLHTWFVTFGLWRADQKSRMVTDAHGRHAVMISRRNEGGQNAAVTSGVTSFKADMQLQDQRLLDVDERRFDEWPGFFLENGSYRVQARENFDRGLPLALIALESQGMMRDRVYGITQTIYHGPYYTRHVVSPAQVLGEAGDMVRAQTHYAVFRTRPGDASEVYNVGRYLDELVRTPAGLKLASRQCIYDSEMVLNSLIYPV